MLRIAHISDLHIRNATLNNDTLSFLQKVAKVVGKEMLGFEVEAGGHDENKLNALKARLAALRPDVIVVTGDLTNFGDPESFEQVASFLRELKAEAGAKKILCVPGNHDCLVERAALLRRSSLYMRLLLFFLAKLNRETEVSKEGAEREFYRNRWRPDPRVDLLGNYSAFCKKNDFESCDPLAPVTLNAGWGLVSFFSFNSVNGPGVMANKGAIGDSQIVKFGNYTLGDQWKEHSSSIRVGLLHHHPISAPQALDGALNRLYDWMEDGPRLLNALNDQRFHFVLHGHQHQPFTCAIDYGQQKPRQTLIVAAGSATQGALPLADNSFNLIDLVSPYEARICRYEFRSVGGRFDENAGLRRIFPLEPIEAVRLIESDNPATVEDWALQALVRNSFRDFDQLGDAFEYEELSYDVTITKDQLYQAKYRRRGKLTEESGRHGPVFVITGSPAMKSADMALSAMDHLTGKALGPPIVLVDEDNFKSVRVQPHSALAVGDAFDVELSFVWQANVYEPNHFDAISLMGFRRPVQKLQYRVRTPWQARQVELETIATVRAQVANVRPARTDLGGGDWEYSFGVTSPPPVAYLFRFAP